MGNRERIFNELLLLALGNTNPQQMAYQQKNFFNRQLLKAKGRSVDARQLQILQVVLKLIDRLLN